MTDAEVQKNLDQLAKITNQLAAEAKRRYGPEGCMFFESAGTFHMMAEDTHGYDRSPTSSRTAGIRFSSNPFAHMDCGAW